MDLEVKIKEEPAWLEGTTNASLPSEDTKEDIFIEEHADDQLLPYIKEETKSGSDVSNADHHPRDGRTRFRCNVCGKSFSRKYTLAVHTRSHTGETSIRGNISGKLFNDKCALQKQTLTHTKKKPHYCNLCGKSFNRKYNVVCHMRTHTAHWRDGTLLEFCGKSFARSTKLSVHTDETAHERHVTPE
ncbi:zinc finger protein 180-like [Anabrus simplex]|uniref:zinc finger protein 180-like n=1 Tax=Anabrus simplex TaxID=316456 RepID=UPI0035A391C6